MNNNGSAAKEEWMNEYCLNRTVNSSENETNNLSIPKRFNDI
jgi:hypothetical protein